MSKSTTSGVVSSEEQVAQFVTVRGTRVPRLGIGTFGMRGAGATVGVRHAIEVGYRHVDTAAMYANEAEVGRGIRESGVARDALWITTKVWHDSLDAAGVLRSAEASLSNLGTDYLDLLLVHWPSRTVPVEESLDAMLKLVEDGRVRQIGVSNFTPKLLRAAVNHAPIFCNQVEYHPLLAQNELAELAERHKILLTAYSPIAQGRVFKDQTLKRIGKRHGKNPAQVAIRWLIQQPFVAAIPRSNQADHRASNFAVWDFALSDQEMEEIAALDRGLRLVSPAFAPWADRR